MTMRYNAHVASGNLNGLTSGSTQSGNSVSVGDISRQKVRALSAVIGVTAATATLTLTARWDVSNDGSTWAPVTNGSQNAAGVALVTGTSAAITRIVPAPDAVYGHKFARCSLVTGGTTAGSSDLYSIGYAYRTGN